MTEITTEPRYAHQVVPEPNGHDYFDPNVTAYDLPVKLATYHAARAWGFHLGSKDGSWIDGLMFMLAEYQIAKMWRDIACTDDVDAPALAVDVVTDLASPHVIGPNIAEILEWAGVDPESIRPYGQAGYPPGVVVEVGEIYPGRPAST